MKLKQDTIKEMTGNNFPELMDTLIGRLKWFPHSGKIKKIRSSHKHS